jgi:hypothetical protein
VLVDAMWILKQGLLGKILLANNVDYILETKSSSELKFVFYLELKDEKYLVSYDFEITRTENESVKVTKENLWVVFI